MKTRMDAVRASVRLPRAAFFTSIVGTCTLIAVLAGALLAASGSSPLLMNVERVNLVRHGDEVPPASELSPAVSVPPFIAEEVTTDAPTGQPQFSVQIIKEEDVLWLSDEVRFFNGRPIRPVKTLTMVVTAYSPDERSCGKWADGITASGYSVWTNGMKLVAADTRILPFGSLVSIPGYDNENVVPVLDRGGAIKGKRLDVLYPTHERALRWGVQELEVTVWDYADGAPNGFRTNHRRR